jgi:hypothetical protein
VEEMASRAAVVTGTDSDLIAYQRGLVRTQQCIPLGRALQIAVAPSDNWRPPAKDDYVEKFGRLIVLRENPLPIAQSGNQLLIMAPMVMPDGRVGLPDVPRPNWQVEDWTPEEVTGKVKRDPSKNRAPMIPQRLTDRCEMVDGKPAALAGTDFLIFQPVVNVVLQPELDKQLVGELWMINFRADSQGRHCALLVDHKTGESFFYGGTFDINRSSMG